MLLSKTKIPLQPLAAAPQQSCSAVPRSVGQLRHTVPTQHTQPLYTPKRQRYNTKVHAAAPETITELSAQLNTLEAQDAIKFVDVPNKRGQDIVICEVIAGSTADAAGLKVGQKLLAISDPVREGELWRLNDRASFRFVRDAFRMRRWPEITLIVTPEPCLMDELQAILTLRSSQSIDTSDSDDDFIGLGVMDPVTYTVTEESMKLVGFTIEREAGVTIGEQLERAYNKARPQMSAYQKRRQKRKERLAEVSGRSDGRIFGLVGAFILGPALIILAIAYASGYLDELSRNQFF